MTNKYFPFLLSFMITRTHLSIGAMQLRDTQTEKQSYNHIEIEKEKWKIAYTNYDCGIMSR